MPLNSQAGVLPPVNHHDTVVFSPTAYVSVFLLHTKFTLVCLCL